MRLTRVVAACTTLWASLTHQVAGSQIDECGGEDEEFGEDCCCEEFGECVERDYDTVFEIVENSVWTVIAHNPLGLTPNNRMIIFRVPPVDGHPDDSLVLINAVDLKESTLQGLNSLSARLNATVRYLLSPGDWHWVYMDEYEEKFPNIKSYLLPGRVPDLAQDSFNYTVIEDVNNPLDFLRPHIESKVISGLRQPFPQARVRYEFAFFHRDSQSLVMGDLIWYHSCGVSVRSRIMFPGVGVQRLHLWNVGGSTIFNDAKAMSQDFDEIMEWNFTRFIPIHGQPGGIVSPEAQPSVKEQLRDTLESWWGPKSPPWKLLMPIIIGIAIACFCADCFCAGFVASCSCFFCKPVLIEEEESFDYGEARKSLATSKRRIRADTYSGMVPTGSARSALTARAVTSAKPDDRNLEPQELGVMTQTDSAASAPESQKMSEQPLKTGQFVVTV